MTDKAERERWKKLQENGMATALSIDHWSAPKSSKCLCETAPDLSVNFICAHPRSPPDSDAATPTPPPPPPDKPAAARFQEIFVDLIGMHCALLDAASRHILDDRFDSILGKGEREFKDALMRLMRSGLTDDARSTPAFRELDGMLQSKMGYRNTYSWSNRRGYVRDDSSDVRTRLERGANQLMGLLGSNETSGTHSDAEVLEEPERKDLRKTLDAIKANAELCRRVGFCGSDAPEETLRSLLQESLSDEDLDVLFDALNDPSFQEESKAFQLLLHPPGHVFVCNASVCDLHCDAFLCPSNIYLRKDRISGTIPVQWLHNTLLKNPKLENLIWPYKFKRYQDYPRAVTHQNWPWEEFRNNQLRHVPFFVAGEVSLENSGLRQSAKEVNQGRRKKSDTLSLPTEEEHIAALMETARQFIAVALLELRSHQPKPRAGRERYLLAMPVIGTGGGFAGDLTGQVVEKLLILLSESVLRVSDADVVLVCADEATYARAQTIRSKLISQHDHAQNKIARHASTLLPFPCFQWMTPEMREYALQLAELASGGHLALFLGAGVSIGSGLPGWFTLLHMIEDLFTPNGTPEERKLGNASKWDPLLMANLLQGICISRSDRNGLQQSLKKRICDYITENAQHPGLLLSLLVSLPCQSIVTQNYDQLIERAFETWNVADPVSSKALSVIPYRPQRNSHNWLLKMHGCVSAPDEIIITGDDYASFETSCYKALGGLVQASLMTKHLLFVGFSLTDPNYSNIIDQVRNALYDSSNEVGYPIRPNSASKLRTQ